MDTIYISNLKVPTRIGITEEERSTEQTLKVSVEMEWDCSKAGTSDAIEDTINYEDVAIAVKELGKQERKTLEKFAEDAAQMILKEFKPHWVKVTAWKFILSDTDGVAVTIERTNESL